MKQQKQKSFILENRINGFIYIVNYPDSQRFYVPEKYVEFNVAFSNLKEGDRIKITF
jgi:hypothetical protein